MKRMLIIVILLFIAILIGLQLKQDPGYVLIAINQWTIETTLWVALFTLFVVFTLTHCLLVLLAQMHQLPANYKLWRVKHSAKIAQEKTRQGLIEFSEGYWSKAKNHLIKALPNTDTPLLNYLTAARAAQEMGDSQLRDNYLRQAQQAMPEAQIAVELTQAQLQLANKQWEQALATLRHLQDMAPKHPYVLKLLLELYQEVKDWTALIHLLPEIKKHHIVPESKIETLYQYAHLQALQLLLKQNQPKAIAEFMDTLPKKLRYDPDIVAAYCRYLLTVNQADNAEKLLSTCLQKQFNEQLITLYGLTACKQVHLQFAESFLKKQANSAELFLCLARACITQQLWGKAHTYLEQSVLLKPTQSAYIELGKYYERMNEPLKACAAYKDAALETPLNGMYSLTHHN